jgi:hypothetical protein
MPQRMYVAARDADGVDAKGGPNHRPEADIGPYESFIGDDMK